MSQNGQDGFFGIIISTKILENKKLTVAEKFVYAYVSSYKNCCADSNARIGDRLGFSERTVTRCLKRLVDLGFLHIEFSKNNNSMRKIHDIYGKPNKKSNLSKNTQKNTQKNSGEVNSFPQVFPQPSTSTLSIDKMSRLHDKMSGQITDRVTTKCLPKNNKNKKKKGEPNKNRTIHTPAGLAGKWPASRLNYTNGKIIKIADLLQLGAY